MFERYDEAARRAIYYARYYASEAGSAKIEPEHVLLGLLRDRAEPLPRLLPAEMTLDKVRERISVSSPRREKSDTTVELPLGDGSKRVLAFAYEESQRLSHVHVGPEHLLLGLLLVRGTLAEEILREYGIDHAAVCEKIGAGASDGSRRTYEGFVSAAPTLRPGLMVDHIGVATRSIEESLGFWRDALGLEVGHTEEVEEQGVRVAMLPVGGPRVELLEPLDDASPVAKFLDKRGAGIHHVAVRVADIRAALARLKSRGARLIDEEPRVGAGGCLIAFVHPAASGGVLLELVEEQGDGPRRAEER